MLAGDARWKTEGSFIRRTKPGADECRIHPTTERALRTWAAQKRLLYVGTEGFSARSVLGKIRDEAEGASHTAHLTPVQRQRWPEVFTGDGLEVNLIMADISHRIRETLQYYYVFQHPFHVPIEQQLPYLGLRNKQEYFRLLGRGQDRVDSALIQRQKYAKPESDFLTPAFS